MPTLIEDQDHETIYAHSLAFGQSSELLVGAIPSGIQLFYQITVGDVAGAYVEVLDGDRVAFRNDIDGVLGYAVEFLVLPEPDFFGNAGNLTFSYERPAGLGTTTDIYDEPVDVTGVPDAPTDLSLSQVSLVEGAGPIKLATILGVDPDGASDHVYSIVSDPSGLFAVSGDELNLPTGADFELLERSPTATIIDENTLSVDMTLRATDAQNETVDVVQTITVINALDRVFLTADDSGEELRGDALEDVLIGGAGNDVLWGLGDDDELRGGGGDDRLISNAGSDSVYGGDGHDFIRTGRQADYVEGGDGDDVIFAAGGVDLIYGGAGDDIINGGKGRDEVWGGAGADTFILTPDNKRDWIMDFELGIDTLTVSLLGGEEVRARQIADDHVLAFIDNDPLHLVAMSGSLSVTEVLGEIGV